MRLSVLITAIYFLFITKIYTQCGVTGFPTQIALSSDETFTNSAGNSILIKELSGGWGTDTAPGIDKDSDHNSGVGSVKLISSMAMGWMVTSMNTPLGIYQIEMKNNVSGCVDTVLLEVVTTLPVVWSKNLTTRKEKNIISLSWSVAQQINNEKFIIEHSLNGSNFKPIGEIKGEGNTSHEINYDYIHQSPYIGVNYYRIKQVDYDGKYEYSNIASIEHQPTEKKLISVYPNPVVDKLTIQSTHFIKLKIYNHFGSLIKQIELTEGNNEIDMSKLKEGIYIFRTEKGEIRRVIKF